MLGQPHPGTLMLAMWTCGLVTVSPYSAIGEGNEQHLVTSKANSAAGLDGRVSTGTRPPNKAISAGAQLKRQSPHRRPARRRITIAAPHASHPMSPRQLDYEAATRTRQAMPPSARGSSVAGCRVPKRQSF